MNQSNRSSHQRTDDEIEIEFDSDEVDENAEEVVHDNGLDRRVDQLEQSQGMMQLLQDPDIQAVLEAKRAGKKISVAAQEEAEEKVDDLLEDMEDDDPAKELLEKVSTLVSNKFKAFENRVGGLESLAETVQKKEVNDQVSSVKDKYPDFEDYRPTMASMVQDNPGLNVEELYLLAKLRAGKLNVPQPSTFTEKPTNQPRKSKKKPVERHGKAKGRLKFNDALKEALGGLDLSDLE